MTRRVVAFCGDQGAGKDTACQALKCYGFEQAAFADPLREVVQTALGITMHEMTDRVLKEQPLDRWPFMSPRQALKLVGTEGFRDNFPGVWIEALKRRAGAVHLLTVSDARFHDEAAAIKEMGGVLIRIDNPRVEPKKDPHRSEIEWKEFEYDAVIVNEFASAADFRVFVASWWSEYAKLLTPV